MQKTYFLHKSFLIFFNKRENVREKRLKMKNARTTVSSNFLTAGFINTTVFARLLMRS